jgi:hypothetical protein
MTALTMVAIEEYSVPVIGGTISSEIRPKFSRVGVGNAVTG